MVKPRHFAVLILLALILFFAATAVLPRVESGAVAQPAPQEALLIEAPAAGVGGDALAGDRVPGADGRAAAAAPALATGGHLPLMIRWSNWQPAFGPALVYAREQDIDGMLRMGGPVQKMLMVTAYDELERLMAHADELHAAGVTIVGLNTENGQGMTPPWEMETLNSPDPTVNFVARAAQLATQNGFKVFWGPVRNMTDAVSDETVRTMMRAGVTGLALQEQKFIEVQPAQARLAEVNHTLARYKRLAAEEGIENFSFHVQIMQQRCPNLGNCVSFVQGLEDIPVDSIAIWSNGPIPADFVTAIRQN